MHRKNYIHKIKKSIRDFYSCETTTTNDNLIKFNHSYSKSTPTLLDETMDFLNSIDVKYSIDENFNIVIER